MIIWGTKTKTKHLGNVKRRCSECKSETFHSFVKAQKYFTLYFIPLFPINTKVLMHCNGCGAAWELKKELKDQLLKKIEYGG
ncbi:zinc ribbon domain-containing protein [Candidatus Woesearchaeota archaeon]|nr:zinc ribbon domain-containing protein [Candidatus Woesearchaeota archaeon]